MDLDAKLYAAEAAAYFRCSRQRINRWRSLGHLQQVDTDASGRPRYRFGDLLAAERKTRRSPNSRRTLAAA